VDHLGWVNKFTTHSDPIFVNKSLSMFCCDKNIDIPQTYYMTETNWEAGFISISKYDRLQPVVDEAAWLESKNYTIKHFFLAMKGSMVISEELALNEMDKTTSCGYPWNLQFGDKRDFLDSPARSALSQFWDSLITEEPHMPIWCCAQKHELRPRKKLLENNIRTFTASPIEHAVALNRLCLDMNNKFYAAHNSTWSFVGSSKYACGFDKLYTRLSRHPHAFELDESQYDSSLFARALIEQGDIRWEMLREEDKTSENQLRFNLLYEDIVHSVIVLENGELIRKHTGNPSGSVNTIVDNTMILFRLLAYAWLMASKKLQAEEDRAREIANGPIEKRCEGLDPFIVSYSSFMANVEAALNGDDNTFTVSHAVLPWFNARTIAREWTAIGVTTKTDVWEPRRVRDVSFLSHSFVWHKFCWLPMMEYDKVMNSLLWASSNDDIRWHLLRAFALRIESWTNMKCRVHIMQYIDYVLQYHRDELFGEINGITMEEIAGVFKVDDAIEALYTAREGLLQCETRVSTLLKLYNKIVKILEISQNSFEILQSTTMPRKNNVVVRVAAPSRKSRKSASTKPKRVRRMVKQAVHAEKSRVDRKQTKEISKLRRGAISFSREKHLGIAWARSAYNAFQHAPRAFSGDTKLINMVKMTGNYQITINNAGGIKSDGIAYLAPMRATDITTYPPGSGAGCYHLTVKFANNFNSFYTSGNYYGSNYTQTGTSSIYGQVYKNAVMAAATLSCDADMGATGKRGRLMGGVTTYGNTVGAGTPAGSVDTGAINTLSNGMSGQMILSNMNPVEVTANNGMTVRWLPHSADSFDSSWTLSATAFNTGIPGASGVVLDNNASQQVAYIAWTGLEDGVSLDFRFAAYFFADTDPFKPFFNANQSPQANAVDVSLVYKECMLKFGGNWCSPGPTVGPRGNGVSGLRMLSAINDTAADAKIDPADHPRVPLPFRATLEKLRRIDQGLLARRPDTSDPGFQAWNQKKIRVEHLVAALVANPSTPYQSDNHVAQSYLNYGDLPGWWASDATISPDFPHYDVYAGDLDSYIANFVPNAADDEARQANGWYGSSTGHGDKHVEPDPVQVPADRHYHPNAIKSQLGLARLERNMREVKIQDADIPSAYFDVPKLPEPVRNRVRHIAVHDQGQFKAAFEALNNNEEEREKAIEWVNILGDSSASSLRKCAAAMALANSEVGAKAIEGLGKHGFDYIDSSGRSTHYHFDTTPKRLAFLFDYARDAMRDTRDWDVIHDEL